MIRIRGALALAIGLLLVPSWEAQEAQDRGSTADRVAPLWRLPTPAVPTVPARLRVPST